MPSQHDIVFAFLGGLATHSTTLHCIINRTHRERQSIEDAKSSKSIVISIVLGCVTMTAAWSFTINALYVLDPFTRDPQTSPCDAISSLLFALALTIPTVSLVLKKIQ